MRILGLLLALALFLPRVGSAQVNGVAVEIALDQQQFLPDEDVIATVRIINHSGQTLELGGDAAWVSFSMQSESGVVVEKQAEFPAPEVFSLKAAQTEIRKFNLTSSFNFRQPGRYRLGATVKIPQWNQNVASKPQTFTIMKGVAIASVPDLEFGVPPKAGAQGGAPEVRKYVLQKAVNMQEPKLYFRLTDITGNKTFKVYPIGPIVSFSAPETQIDGESKLHLLYQFFSKSFCYCVIDPDGKLLVRQIYDYTQTRPTLRTDSDGRIYVGGGVRKYSPSDLPVPVMATFPATTNADTNVTTQ